MVGITSDGLDPPGRHIRRVLTLWLSTQRIIRSRGMLEKLWLASHLTAWILQAVRSVEYSLYG